MKSKICATCNRVFTPSSNHKDCPKCRAKKRKEPCKSCGDLTWKKSEICKKCVSLKMENNANWKGGKIKHIQSGYIQIKTKNRPNAPKNGYVMEHRLVMEDYLGRYLCKNERVHHKNGIRTDNRIENLELWTSNHPHGSRVKDLIVYAKEILEKYGSDESMY